MLEVLVLDAGSPVVSVAVGPVGRPRATAAIELRRSAEVLLRTIDELLGQAGLAPSDLDRIVVLRGPGSFTGLRVGLATGLGLARSLGTEPGVLDTLDVLALAAEAPCRAAVYAQRGDWMLARYDWNDRPELREAPTLVAEEALHSAGPILVTQDAERLPDDIRRNALVAPPLAEVALRGLDRLRVDSDPGSLAEPLYFRAPAVSRAGRRS